MKSNLGNKDQLIRISIASALLILCMLQILQGTWAGTTATFALMLMVTAWLGFCPLYRLFGISTHDRYDQKRK